MLFNVAGLLSDEVGATRKESLKGERIETPDGVFDDIAGSVNMLRTDRTVLVTARLTAETVQTCSRCLEPARVALETVIEEEYYPVNADLVAGARGRVGEGEEAEDEALVIDDRNMLDLTEVVRQALTAALPLAPLCRPDCAGICPVCARDRNLEPCDCEEETAHPALASIAKLLARDAN
ncbi:MAG: DUF177 domain-containing protein [Gemmatimonadetes bacterium]|nr:DUF177 domain-containing protein [Gemmatimonadota bacterium]